MRATTPSIAEAGCMLADVQTRRQTSRRFFPLSLGSEGSCQIGGNLSTNAGGTNVLRYGMMRDLVLGLEVVLADGRVLDSAQRAAQGQHRLRHQVAVPRRRRHARRHHRGRASSSFRTVRAHARRRSSPCRTCNAAVALLARLREASGDRVSSFELIPRIGVELDHAAHLRASPIRSIEPYAWYVLCELSSVARRRDARCRARSKRSKRALERGLVLDAR